MKKVLLLVAVLATIGLASCKNTKQVDAEKAKQDSIALADSLAKAQAEAEAAAAAAIAAADSLIKLEDAVEVTN